MSTRERLHEIIDELSDEQPADLEAYAEHMLDEDDDEIFTEDEIERILKIQAQALGGDTVKWEDIEKRLGLDVQA